MKNLIYIATILMSFTGISQELDRSNNRLLWEISGNGLKNPSYLYGSFHNNSKEVFKFPDSTLWALDQADAVVLETSITEMMNRVDVREKKAWWEFYVTKDITRNKAADEDHTRTSYGDDEGNTQFIDMFFQQVADNCDKEFYPLEKISDQMKLSVIPKTIKEGVNLKALGKEIEDFDMQEAYLRGDIVELYEFTKKTSEIYEGYFEALLPDRNKIMANGLDTLMHQHKVFCAVGAAHLSGEEGVIQLLKDKGYTLRPVVPVYTDELEVYFEKFKKCNGYMYRDDLYGFKVRLNGKPKVTDEDGARRFTYQEMGQGNSYHMQIRYLEKQVNWNDFALSYFITDNGDTSVYNTLTLKDGTRAYEGLINENTPNALWVRSFTKNDISYLMYCNGGSKFMNSNRPQEYFNKFEFLPEDLYDVTDYDTILTPTKTLELILPKGGVTTDDKGDQIKWWKHIYFNPATGESYYIYETVLIDDIIYVHSDHYGEYLLEEYNKDSITYYDSIVSDNYLQKSFRATLYGKPSYGVMRKEGNVLQFVQYKGKNEANRDKFLNSFKRKPFEGPTELVSIRRMAFSTKVPPFGFKPLKTDFDAEYLKYKHYVLNDLDNATIYEVRYTKYEPWAFREDSLRKLLRNEVRWPANNYETVVDTVFNMSDSIPSMEYSIYYKESHNYMRGKSFIKGKEIITYKLTHPISMSEIYKSTYFMDSIELKQARKPTINDYSIADLQKQLDGDEDDKYEMLDFLYYSDFTPATAKKLLYELDGLDYVGSEDKPYRASGRYYLTYELDSAQVDDALYDYWIKHSRTAEPSFNSEMLEKFANHATEDKYMHNAVRYINQNKIELGSTYDFMDFLNLYPERYQLIWEEVQTLLLKDLDPPSSMYADLIEIADMPFYNTFIKSKDFKKYSLKKKRKPWVKTRYFEALIAANESQETIISSMKKWKVGDSYFDRGGKIAVEHKVKGKLTPAQEEQLDYTVSAMRYCEVMNRMGDSVLYKEKFSYLDYLGYIGLEYFLNNNNPYGYNTLEFENMVVFTDHKGVERTFAHFAVNRFGRIYRFIIELPEGESIPTRTELDDTFYDLGEAYEYPLEDLIDDIKEHLEAEDDGEED